MTDKQERVAFGILLKAARCFSLEWGEFVKKRNWFLLVIGIWLCLCQPDYAYAASAALELQCLADEIYKEEQFEVELLVTTDVTLGDFEGYLMYDDSVIEYVTGPSCITGGGGMLKIADIGADKTNTPRNYLLRFRAVNQGKAEISFYDTPMVYAYETGLTMSVFSNVLSLNVLPAKDASSDSSLKSLRVSPGRLSPGFLAEVTTYDVTIPYENDSIIISAAAADAKASVTVHHNTGLLVGMNEVKVVVTAEDETETIYVIYVTREEEVKEPEVTPVVQPEAEQGVHLKGVEKEKVVLSAYKDFAIFIKSDDVPAPTDYEEVWINIGGVQVRGFAKREEENHTFYIVVAEEADGSKAYYRYDSVGQTIQRFAPEEITIKNVIADDTQTELLYDTIADYQSRQYFLLLLVTIFASTTAIAGILAIRFFLKAKSTGEELGD